jgi:hypothetical protein
MPLYEYRCSRGHRSEHYSHTFEQALRIWDCDYCMRPALRVLSTPNMLQFFSESSPQTIEAIDPQRPITSPAEHNRLMKEHGLEPATQWHTSRYKQTDGLVPRAPRPVRTEP